LEGFILAEYNCYTDLLIEFIFSLIMFSF
jgi:hypothetical protein